MIRLTSILFFTFPMLVAADDQLPQPDYQRQPSDPPWLARSFSSTGIWARPWSPGRGWA